jgi:hypothetical protein
MNVHVSYISKRMRTLRFQISRPLSSDDLAKEIWLHVPEDKSELLLKAWAKRSGKHILVQTLCSGTDSPVFALRDCASVFNEHAQGIPCGYVQTMACEKNDMKRKFIAHNSRLPVCPLIFHEVSECSANTTAREGVYRNNVGPMRTVPRANDILWSSISCKGSSMENNSRSSNGRMLFEGKGETAITLAGTVGQFSRSTAKLGSDSVWEANKV